MSKRQRCDQVFVLAVIISAAILCAPQPAETTKLETQIKLLINDDELLLQPQHQHQQRQLQLQQQQQHRLQQQQPQVHPQPTTDDADEAHYNLYRSELKRLSYETIHRILRDENEPVYRREDAELRYYQKRSYQPRHELVRRSTTGQTEPYLNLSHNALRVYNGAQQFQSDSAYAAIKRIDLSDNQLVEIKNLERFTNMQTLDLHGNALAALTLDGICHATGTDVPLTTLNLNGNRIQNGTAPPCAQLRQLHLSGNAIKSLNALNLSALAALETLDLSGNELRNLETAFFPQRMHNLKHLNLANNQLGSIYRETFYNLLSLNTLLLRGNNISDIDYETFLALPNLQYLDLSHNQLHGTAIRALQGIPDLMGLSIAYNPQVGAAMQEFVASWSLKELDASGTGLCQIPAALAQSVRTLKLTDNWLKVINCGDLDSYPLLQYLDLSHSRIEDIEDDALGRLEILETLFLDHNRLHRVPLSLPTSLNQLFLQDNQIMEIQVQAFQGLNNLQTLDLSGNKLLYLPALPLPKLLTLNVQAAELKGVSQAIVHTLPRLRDLLLENNPIKCSDLMGLAEWASACRIVDDAIEIPTALDGSSGAQTVAVADADADVGQQTKGAKIDLKQQYVQMHNFYEKFKSNCGLTRQITMTSATAPTPPPTPPTCVAKPDTTMMTVADAMPTRSSRGATFVANENTEMPNEKLTGIISLPSEKTPQATPLLPTSSAMLTQSRAAEVATANSESMSKVTSSVATISSAETTKPTAATKEQPLNNNNNNNNKNMPNTWTSGSLSHKTQTKQKANMTMSNNTNSLLTAQTLRPTETTTTTTTVTTLLAKHANQMNQQQQQQQQHEQQMPRMPTEATAKHANHVAIANETISLQTAKRQTTTTTATSTTTTATTTTQTPTAMATAINSGRQTQLTTAAAAAAAVESTMPMGVTESVLNNGSSLAQPVTISAVATPTTTTTTTTITAVETKVEAATTTVAATKVPQTILTAIKSGRQQQQQQEQYKQQRHSDDETRSLLNQNNIVANAIITNRVAGIEFVDNNDSNSNNNNIRASLSDTSGQPTITKMETAPKTNAKMSTQQQQQQEQQQQRTTLPTQPTSQSLSPPHKHEPLQLHIKDRHLIGTPLLMHKGENVLVDAEQLLLPGTATVAGNAHTHVAAVAVAANDASLQTPSFTTTTTTTATSTTTNYNNNKKQASGKGNAAGADILAHSQFDKQTTVRLKQHSGQPEAINVQTNTHYSDTKLAVDKSDNEAQQHKHKVLKDKEVKFNGGGSKKMKPSLSMKKMTYSTKHATTTPKTTTSASSTDSAEYVEPLLLHMKQQQQQQQQHNSVNTPNAANIEHELNTFAQLQASAQLDQAQASLPLRHTHASDLSKSEQWLDTRPAATHTGHSHPGVVLLLSVGLVILLLVGLMHVYRCDMPWRRHAHGVRPHRRQFNDDDAHSFLHYQGGSGSVSGSGGGSSNNLPIQKWHHSTRREAPYSSPLHNLHVRELQKSATGAQSQDKAQLRQHFYSATLNANAAGGTSSSSSASSSASSSCGLNRSPASSIMADESFYIEMTPDVSAQQHACDLLPMELLAGSSVSNSQDELTLQTTTTTMSANGDQREFEYQTRKTMSNKLAPSTRRLGIW